MLEIPAMSDVVAAALIAGLVGLCGSVATIVVMRLSAGDLKRQRDVEWLHELGQERKKAYADLAWHLNRLHKFSTIGFPPSCDDWMDWLDQYEFTTGVVLIVGTPTVVDAVGSHTVELEAAAPALRLAVTQYPDGTSWPIAYAPYADCLEDASRRLFDAMRADAQAGRVAAPP